MTNQPLTIGVLETGRPPENELPIHGDYPTMVADWLAPLNAQYKSYAVLDGTFPNHPKDCDLWVITGSRYSVYEDHDWIAPLEGFIRACRDAGQKMVGICFGHQLIAQALGGTVEKSDKGWGLGIHEYSPSNWPPELGQPIENIKIQAFHQDQVITPPKGAKTIASSDFCENAAIWYPGFALTVQGHPEFAKPYTTDLLQSRRGNVLPPAKVDSALAAMNIETNQNNLAVFIRDNLDAI